MVTMVPAREKKDVDGREPGHDDLDGSWILTGRTVLWWLLAFFGVVIGINTVMMEFAIGTMPGLNQNHQIADGCDDFAGGLACADAAGGACRI